MGLNGTQWDSMGLNGTQWDSMRLNETQWDSNFEHYYEKKWLLESTNNLTSFLFQNPDWCRNCRTWCVLLGFSFGGTSLKINFKISLNICNNTVKTLREVMYALLFQKFLKQSMKLLEFRNFINFFVIQNVNLVNLSV